MCHQKTLPENLSNNWEGKRKLTAGNWIKINGTNNEKTYPVHRCQAAFNFSSELWRHNCMWHSYHLSSKVHSCTTACSEMRNHSPCPSRLPHIWLLPGWKEEGVHLAIPFPPACSKKASKAEGRMMAHVLMKEAWPGRWGPVPINSLLTDLFETLASRSSHLFDSKDQILSEMRVPAQWLTVLSDHIFDKYVPSVPSYLDK